MSVVEMQFCYFDYLCPLTRDVHNFSSQEMTMQGCLNEEYVNPLICSCVSVVVVVVFHHDFFAASSPVFYV